MKGGEKKKHGMGIQEGAERSYGDWDNISTDQEKVVEPGKKDRLMDHGSLGEGLRWRGISRLRRQ